PPRNEPAICRLIVTQECSELRGRLEEWNRIKRLQCGGERVGEGPHRARSEFRVTRLKVVPVNIPSEGSRHAEIAFDERLIYNQFRLFIGELPGTPGVDLIAEQAEIALDAVHPDGQRIHD